MYFEFRRIHSSLKPWGLTQSIFDANPDLPAQFYGCFPWFTWKNFSDTTEPHPINPRGFYALFWCSDHGDYECGSLPDHLRLQLACGLLSADEYETACSFMHGQGTFKVVGSHRCHNAAFCMGLTCVTYETQTMNMIRDSDKRAGDELIARKDRVAASEVTCTCWAGIATGKPCLMDRHSMDEADVRRAFIELLKDNEREVCRCSLCDHIVLEQYYYDGTMPKRWSGLSNKQTTVGTIKQLLTEHMVAQHGYKAREMFVLH